MPTRRTTLACMAAAAALSVTGLAAAQAKYPEQTVQLIVALPAGGSVDMIARALGQKLNVSLGVPFIVDNRGGASGQIGMPMVAKAPADGYTLTVSPASFLTTNKSVFKTLPYDPEADFTPVTRLVNQPMVLIVKDKQKYPSVAALIAAAKAKPDELTHGSAGVGTLAHEAAEMINDAAKIQLRQEVVIESGLVGMVQAHRHCDVRPQTGIETDLPPMTASLGGVAANHHQRNAALLIDL